LLYISVYPQVNGCNFNLTQLFISLEQGFNNDSVIIKVNDKEVFRKDGVTSGLIKSAEKSFVFNLEEGEVTVQVNIPSRNLVDKKQFTIAHDKFLAISLVKQDISPSGIRFIISDESVYDF